MQATITVYLAWSPPGVNLQSFNSRRHARLAMTSLRYNPTNPTVQKFGYIFGSRWQQPRLSHAPAELQGHVPAHLQMVIFNLSTRRHACTARTSLRENVQILLFINLVIYPRGSTPHAQYLVSRVQEAVTHVAIQAGIPHGAQTPKTQTFFSI